MALGERNLSLNSAMRVEAGSGIKDTISSEKKEMLQDNPCSSKWLQSKACRNGISTKPAANENAFVKSQFTAAK